jgi:quaternary ammonium compound-resistance protein SugE
MMTLELRYAAAVRQGTTSGTARSFRKEGPNMAWMFLLVAGLLEIVWSFTMKLSQGFTRGTPTAVTILVMVASFALLSISMKTLPLGTAYTVWTGIGAAGAFVVGVVVLGEPLTIARVLAAALIVAGLTIMKLTTSA